MNRRGQALLIALLLFTLAVITLPLVVYSVQNEGRWAVKAGRSSIAYHLAEAGQDRAVAYLARSEANWNSVFSGSPAAGYVGDVQYSDLGGGLYEVNISSGPGAGQVTVLTKGRDASTKETRAIQAVYTTGTGDLAGGPLLSGFVVQGAMSYSSTMRIYWGQITSYTSLTVASPYPYHPLKVSAGAISPWDTSANPPNSNATKGYTAYDTNLGSSPSLDFDYYRAVAQATSAPIPSSLGGNNGSQTAAWRGTGYFDAGAKVQQVDFKNYTFVCSTCVLFVEGDNAVIDGSGYMHVGALIIRSGNIHIHNSGANPYTVSVPTDVWKQYVAGTAVNGQSPDTSAVDEYPGDGGYHATKPTYTIPTPAFDGSGNTGMAFHGLLYANSFNCSGGDNTLVGQFLVGPGGMKVNTMVLYYDPTVATGAHYANGQVVRMQWNELVSPWP